MWMFVTFYAIALVRRPWRLFTAVYGVLRGYEETRLAKWLNDVFVVRPRWNRQVRKVIDNASAWS